MIIIIVQIILFFLTRLAMLGAVFSGVYPIYTVVQDYWLYILILIIFYYSPMLFIILLLLSSIIQLYVNYNSIIF